MLFIANIVAALLAAAPGADTLPWVRPEPVELGRKVAHTICGSAPPTRIEHAKNLHDPKLINRLETRECDAGRSQILFSPTATNPDGLPLSLKVKSASYPLPAALRVGNPSTKLSELLGAPTENSEGRLTFVLTESSDTIIVETKDGVITSVEWQFYSG